MHDIPRQKLCELLAKHGHGLCDDARKLEGLLKDVLRNGHKRETSVLISALREGVVHELRGSTLGMPPAALAAKLARQLCDNLGLDDGVARWSVESWCVALNLGPMVLASVPAMGHDLELDEPSPSVATRPNGAETGGTAGLDLAALAKQHLSAAQQAKVREAQAKAQADRVQAETKQLAKVRDAQAKTQADQVQVQAKRLAEQTRDFTTAARMIEELDPRWRDTKLYAKICGYRDRVTELDVGIQNAVQKGHLEFLRGRVQSLLKLQPRRDDMRRLLEVLPKAPKEFTNSIGMRFTLIEPGQFTMGSHEFDNEQPPHLVEITQPFYLSVFPVTQAEYQAVTGSNPSHFKGNAQHPVENVSWDDTVAYCEKLSQLAAEAGHGRNYRLPTEAEWEYACRAGSTGKWCFGDNESILEEYGWISSNSGDKTHPVGEKKANDWGLHDLHGNVMEWCQDTLDQLVYRHRSGMTSDPLVTTKSHNRVLRGGAWDGRSRYTRSADRSGWRPDARSFNFGFRVVR